MTQSMQNLHSFIYLFIKNVGKQPCYWQENSHSLHEHWPEHTKIAYCSGGHLKSWCNFKRKFTWTYSNSCPWMFFLILWCAFHCGSVHFRSMQRHIRWFISLSLIVSKWLTSLRHIRYIVQSQHCSCDITTSLLFISCQHAANRF